MEIIFLPKSHYEIQVHTTLVCALYAIKCGTLNYIELIKNMKTMFKIQYQMTLLSLAWLPWVL